MDYVVYYRVSTQKQGKSGLGLEAQEHAVNEYLATKGGKLLSSFTDIESGSKNDRPELQKALRKCRLTGSTLLIAKLDRLSRNRRFLFELMDSSTKFVCCDMPEANSLTVGLMACLADYERQLISERTKAALQAAKKRGVKLGNPRLSECRNNDTRKATEARSHAAMLRNVEVFSLIQDIEQNSEKTLSLRQIAKELNALSYKTSRGCDWTGTAVSRVKSHFLSYPQFTH